MTRKIAICNQKGGVGKTTTAINMAAALALAGKRCLLVDLDPQANATSGLGSRRSRERGIGAALLEPELTPECLTTTRYELLDIIPSHAALAMVEQSLVKVRKKERRLAQAVGCVEARYDYVLIDCPPSLGLLPLNALVYADSVLIPIQCEYFAMEGLGQIIAAIRETREKLNPRIRAEGVLFTMFDADVELSHEVMGEVTRHFGDLVYRQPIPRDVLLAEAASHGISIFEYNIGSNGARGYVELAREVIEHERQETRAGV